MARSQKDVPAYDDWNFQANPQAGSQQMNAQHQDGRVLIQDARLLQDSIPCNSHSMNFEVNHPEATYNAGSMLQNDMYRQPVVSPMMPNYPSDNGNSKVMRVFYDKNNQPQYIVPVEKYEPYELFSASPHQMSHFSNGAPPPINPNEQYLNNQPVASQRQTNLIDHLLGNYRYWAPFGQNYPLNTPNNVCGVTQDPIANPITLPTINHVNDNNISLLGPSKPVEPLKTGTNLEVTAKPRAVAEVKPMRPSYSDVLNKNPTKEKADKSIRTDSFKKVKNGTVETKTASAPKKTDSAKSEKARYQSRTALTAEEKIGKNNYTSQVSSGSDSGDNNVGNERNETFRKSTKLSKSKTPNVRRKWSSLDNLGDSDDKNADDSPAFNSDFIFVASEEAANAKKQTNKKSYKVFEKRDSYNYIDNLDDYSKEYSEYQQDTGLDADKIKNRKPRSANANSKSARPGSEKKKLTQTRMRKFKRHGYFGIIQTFMNNWISYIMKFLLWIWNLVSDILSMSAHLSFDLLSVTCTQGYDYSQAVWKSMKLYLSKATTGKIFLYIDRKFGHTRFGFWRKIKWFKKHLGTDKNDDDDGEPIKNNKNIPLPATGEEAMKRLLACKGKDPYSILGVGVNCNDEEIKRYYRKQAFLVHPDKNQQPGAEEAFKILQHAFELIGEPEKRTSYDRRVLESHHVEAAWSELNDLLAQLHEKMEFAANTIRCTNCGRRHKRVLTDRPCYAARACSQCKIRHSAKEGDIWAETSLWGLVLVFYACMEGAVYQITQWASCQKKNLKHLRPDCHVVQYRIVLGNKAGAAVGSGSGNGPGSSNTSTSSPGASVGSPSTSGTTKHHNNNQDVNLEEFLNSFYSKSAQPSSSSNAKTSTCPSDQHDSAKFKRRNRKGKV